MKIYEITVTVTRDASRRGKKAIHKIQFTTLTAGRNAREAAGRALIKTNFPLPQGTKIALSRPNKIIDLT